jgi:hypothetical protein
MAFEVTAPTKNYQKQRALKRHPTFAARLGPEIDRLLSRLAEERGLPMAEVIRRLVLDEQARELEGRQASYLEGMRGSLVGLVEGQARCAESISHLGSRIEALISIVRQQEIEAVQRLEQLTHLNASIEQLCAITAMRVQAMVEESNNPKIRETAARLLSQLQQA